MRLDAFITPEGAVMQNMIFSEKVYIKWNFFFFF